MSSKKVKAYCALGRMIEEINRHIELDEAGLREVEIATNAFRASLWSEEADQKITEAVNFYLDQTQAPS